MPGSAASEVIAVLGSLHFQALQTFQMLLSVVAADRLVTGDLSDVVRYLDATDRQGLILLQARQLPSCLPLHCSPELSMAESSCSY